MAAFILQAVPASFIRSGDIVLCNVAMRAAPIFRQPAEVKSEAEAMALMAEVRAALKAMRQPYSLTLRLADKRAPRHFKQWIHSATRHDESFGSEAAQ